MKRQRQRLCYLAFAAWIGATGCHEPQVGSIYVKAKTIAAAVGGTLEVTAEEHEALAGARIEIPAHALSRDTRITVTLGSSVIPRDGSGPSGPVVSWGPAQTQLAIPARVTTPFTSPPHPTLARVYSRHSDGPDITLPDQLHFSSPRLATSSILVLGDLQAARANSPCDGKSCPSGHVCRNGGCWQSCALEIEPSQLRILFVVDQTVSMQASSPQGAHLAAMTKVVDSFVNANTGALAPQVAFAVVGFADSAVVYTRDDAGGPGFSRDTGHIHAALAQPSSTSDHASYFAALEMALALVDSDASSVSVTSGEHAAYHVVFVTDSSPTAGDCTVGTSAANAIHSIKALNEVARFHHVELAVSTAFVATAGMFAAPLTASAACCMGIDAPLELVENCSLDGGTITEGVATRELLSTMAQVGHGRSVTFSDTSPASFEDIDFLPKLRPTCDDGYKCEPTMSSCLPQTPPSGSHCDGDHECGFRSVCVGGSCVSDEFGCGDDCVPDATDPVRILFAVDTSLSMRLADPMGKLAATIEDAIGKAQTHHPSVAFRIVGFDAQTRSIPQARDCPVFTHDKTALFGFLTALQAEVPHNTLGGLLDVQGALNVIHADVRADMLMSSVDNPCKPDTPEGLARTHYIIVFIAAGAPAPSCKLGIANDLSLPANLLCDTAGFANCLRKAEGTVCDAVAHGYCDDGATGCRHHDEMCCDYDFGWNAVGASPSSLLFGGGAPPSELVGGWDYNQDYQLDSRVRDIIELRQEFAVGNIHLHTVLLSPQASPVAISIREQWQHLAHAGRGTHVEITDVTGLDLSLLSPAFADEANP